METVSGTVCVTPSRAFVKALLGVTQTVPLTVSIDGGQVYTGQVYTSAISDLVKTFVDGRNVGTFKVILIEPEPTV